MDRVSQLVSGLPAYRSQKFQGNEMPVILRHVLTQKRYILVGPAYGFSKTNRTNLAFDMGYASFEEKLIVACDANGDLHWLNANEMSVESVDGKTCRDVLGDSLSLPSDSQQD